MFNSRSHQFNSLSRQGLGTTKAYERDLPTGEVVLFGALLVLPVALLLVLSLFAG